jgi:Glyceraldehyde 3-phosphate dehydrogenase, NAD binding domain
MPVRVAINGFGRVGRSFLRAAHEQDADIEVVAVNDLVAPSTLAQLLKYDSVYGRFPGEVLAHDDGISVDGVHVRALADRPAGASLDRDGGRRRDRIDGTVSHPRRRRCTSRGRRSQGDHFGARQRS